MTMENSKIIGISYKVKWLDIQEVGRKGKFKFVPAVNYKIDGSSEVKLVNYPDSLQLFTKGVSMELLAKYSDQDIKKEEFKVAQRAYRKLRDFAYRCADRVIADLICGIILQYSGEGENVIYIIQKPPSDKIMGRLGYLYLPIKELTILFISWRPEDLITNVMQHKTGKLEFDLHRLMSEEKEGLVGPYPGNPTETLKQTYFYSPPKQGKRGLFPIRIDIFSQGLLESDFRGKEKVLEKLLQERNLTPPFELKEGIFIRLHRGLKDCIDAWQHHEKQLDLILKKE